MEWILGVHGPSVLPLRLLPRHSFASHPQAGRLHHAHLPAFLSSRSETGDSRFQIEDSRFQNAPNDH